MPPRQKKHSTSMDHRLVYEALVELVDVQEHIISPGELFTQTLLRNDVRDGVHRDGFWPVCRECRPFELRAPIGPPALGPHVHPNHGEPHSHEGTMEATGHDGPFAIAHSHAAAGSAA